MDQLERKTKTVDMVIFKVPLQYIASNIPH